ncbi:hypothetical protein HK101_010125 [Irineochytrium annulatum]|nr:hypothetical protein HK101_010125 [Irineochytrium annulatum]
MATTPSSSRFVDYFFQVGISPAAKLSEKVVPDSDLSSIAQPDPSSMAAAASEESVHFDDVQPTPIHPPYLGGSGDSMDTRGSQVSLATSLNFLDPKLPRVVVTTDQPKIIPDQPKALPVETSAMTPCASKMKRTHPIEYKFEGDVLCRYPTTDYSEEEAFPNYLPMIITKADASRLYGVCVTVYEKLHPSLASQLETMIEDWRSECLAQSDLEYMQHIQSQLAVNQEAILKIKNGAKTDPRNPDPEAEELDAAQLTDLVAEAEEKVALFRELLAPLQSLLVDVDNVYAPRTIGLLSHWPWHDLLNDWLRELLKVVTGHYDYTLNRPAGTYAPLERSLINLMCEVPLPPPGRVELCISIGQLQLFCSRPPVNSIQVLQNFSLYPFFRTLSLPNIVTLFELGLMEKKIIFVSSHLSMLTFAVESLCLLFYPLTYPHVLIPVLPKKLLSYLWAPMPFIIGVHRDYFQKKDQDEYRPVDAAVVDIDNNIIEIPPGIDLPTIPPRDRKKLLARLYKYTGTTFPTGSNQNLSQQKEAMKGVPITIKYAYPNGVLVPFANLSRRWVANEVEVAAHKALAAATSQKSLRPDRRTSLDSVRADPSHSLSPNGQTYLTPGHTLTASRSLDGSEDADRLHEMTRSRKPTQDTSRRRTRSATPEYGDPNTLPPLAPLVISGDDPSNGAYIGIPVKTDDPEDNPSDGISLLSRNQSVATRISMSVASTTSSAITSPTFFNQVNNGNGPTPSPASPAQSNSGGSLQNLAALRHEGHVFTEVRLEPAGREADIGDDDVEVLTSLGTNIPSTTNLSATPLNSNDQLSAPPVREVSKGLPTFSRVFGVKSRSSSRDQLSNNDLSSQLSLNGNTSGKRQVTGSATLLKGDCMPKMPEHLCRLCQEELRNPENPPVLKCECKLCTTKRRGLSNARLACGFSIHSKCLPLIECHPCINTFNDRKIQASFLKVFTSLLKNYRTCLVIPEPLKRAMEEDAARKGSEVDLCLTPSIANIQGMNLVLEDWFKKEDFINGQDKESKPFLSQLVNTQSFAQFTLDRIERPESDYEILFFDESIKAKLNRSKLKLSKETTPFLKDSTYNIRATVAIASPNLESLDPRNDFVTLFPTTLDDSLLIPPRSVHPLVNQADQRMMRSHTIELVQRARAVSGMKRKKDLAKWMQTYFKHFQKIGNGQIVSIGHLSDEQRRELFEERLKAVTEVIDRWEGAHLSSMSPEEVNCALDDLHAQHLILMRAADEEQLVDGSDQDELQNILFRLFRVLTIYEDHRGTIDSPLEDSPLEEVSFPREKYAHPLAHMVGAVHKEIVEMSVRQNVVSIWKKVEREVSLSSLPSSVRSRSSSLRSFKGKKGISQNAPAGKSLNREMSEVAANTPASVQEDEVAPPLLSPVPTEEATPTVPILGPAPSPKSWTAPQSAETPVSSDLEQIVAVEEDKLASKRMESTMSLQELAAITKRAESFDGKMPFSRETSGLAEANTVFGLSKLVAATRMEASSNNDNIMDALDAIKEKLDGSTNPSKEASQGTWDNEESNKLIRKLKRRADILQGYDDDMIRNIIGETKFLFDGCLTAKRDIDALKHSVFEDQEEEMEAKSRQKSLQVALTMHQLSITRNKRALLIYHRHRVDLIRAIAWDLGGGAAADSVGGDADGGNGTGFPVEVRKNMSPAEHDFLSSYRELLGDLRGSFMDVDIGAPLVPPRDLYIEVRVLREIGEVVLDSGSIVRLTKHSQHYLRRTDVENFISMGYMRQIS